MASLTITPPWSAFDHKDYKNLAVNPESPTYTAEQQEKYRWVEYHKWKFRAKTYTALTNGQKCFVLMTRVEFGLLGSYNKYKKSPFETYYMGGDGMSGYSTGYAEETIGLRGYDNGSLTPYGYEAMPTTASLLSFVIRSCSATPQSMVLASLRQVTHGTTPRTSTRST